MTPPSDPVGTRIRQILEEFATVASVPPTKDEMERAAEAIEEQAASERDHYRSEAERLNELAAKLGAERWRLERERDEWKESSGIHASRCLAVERRERERLERREEIIDKLEARAEAEAQHYREALRGKGHDPNCPHRPCTCAALTASRRQVT